MNSFLPSPLCIRIPMESNKPNTLTISLAEWVNLLNPVDATDLPDLEDSLFGLDFSLDDENKNARDSKQNKKNSHHPQDSDSW